MSKIIPTPVEIGRETITLLAGALLAAWIVGQLPSVRAWMRAQWGGQLPANVTY